MINRKIKPVSEEKLSFSLPEIHQTTLTNGLKVFYIRKQKLPITKIDLLIECGSKFDPENKKGLSQLTSMVLDEGADGLSALDISDIFDTLGSNFSISSGSDSIIMKLQSLSENFEKSLEIFTKILLKPDFNQKDFEREKKKLQTRLLQLSDEPEFLAQQIFEHLVFSENNPYSFSSMGYQDNIISINNDDVKNFYSDSFSPNTSNLVAVGNNDFDSFTKIIEKYFVNWKSMPRQKNLTFEAEIKQRKVYFFHKENSVQSEIRIGHHSLKRNSYDYFHRLLLNTILGGQFTSRINLNLREKKGYTYGAFSSFSYYKEAAFFYVSTSVGKENTVDAINEIYKELESIKKGVSNEEMEFAKSSIIKKFPSNFETYRQIAGNLTTMVFHSLSSDFFDTYIFNVENVAGVDVKEAAQNLIHPEQAFCVVVGDRLKLYDSLKSFGFDVVEVNEKGTII